jgi:hypothetical protein
MKNRLYASISMVVYDPRTMTVLVERRDSVYIYVQYAKKILLTSPMPVPSSGEKGGGL